MQKFKKKITYKSSMTMLFVVVAVLIVIVFVRQEFFLSATKTNEGSIPEITTQSEEQGETKTKQTYIDPGKGTPIVVPPVAKHSQPNTTTEK